MFKPYSPDPISGQTLTYYLLDCLSQKALVCGQSRLEDFFEDQFPYHPNVVLSFEFQARTFTSATELNQHFANRSLTLVFFLAS